MSSVTVQPDSTFKEKRRKRTIIFNKMTKNGESLEIKSLSV